MNRISLSLTLVALAGLFLFGVTARAACADLSGNWKGNCIIDGEKPFTLNGTGLLSALLKGGGR